MSDTQVVDSKQVSKANGAVKATEPTSAELMARIAQLEAQLATKQNQRIELRISENTGVVSAYGLGRFPVSLHEGGWRRLLGEAKMILAFIDKYHANLSEKDVDWNPEAKLKGVPEHVIKRNKQDKAE